MLAQNHSDQPTLIVGNYTVFPQQLLGKGSTGSVFRGLNNVTKMPVAVKTIELAKINDDATQSLLENQKMALRLINGQYVLKLQDIIQEKGVCYIITQLCEGQTLRQYLKKQNKLTQKEAVSIFQKIATGCLALTQQCIIHRDLKPANIMIDSQGNPKIIDFGYCQIIMAKKVMKTFNVGSPSYMSPEAYQRTLYSQKSDSWALGMTLYEMLHGETLDSNIETKAYFQQLKNESFVVQKKLSQSLSAQMRQIIKSALKYLPQQRSSINNLKYQADCYQIKYKQNTINMNKNSQRLYQPINYQAVRENDLSGNKLNTRLSAAKEQENRQVANGFVSYQDFLQAHPRFNYPRVVPLQQKTPYDFNRRSVSKQKLDSYVYKIVRQPQNLKRNVSVQTNLECVPIVAEKDSEQCNRGQNAAYSMRRQVTVRYL